MGSPDWVNESLPITVREVVTMGRYPTVGAYGRLRSADRDAVERAMTRMGITHLSHRHLHDLSGGQRQRVFIAQGLAEDHDLLLFDEPLTGLDLPSAKVIDEVIHEEPQRGHTVVLTTHDLSEAGHADNVILMGGRVIAEGLPADVLVSDNLAEAYGPGLLHMEPGQMFIDDPAHLGIPGRHDSGT
jgi:manganese transport system ATP-binding protein